VVTINATPTILSTLSAVRCEEGTLMLEATANLGTINWFDAASGGSSLYTGTSFTTRIISTTTTYYAEVVNASCVNNTRTAVVATIGGCIKIQASQCGVTITNVNRGVWSQGITGATYYKFEITDPSNNVTIIESTVRNFKFSQFAFTNNTTYSVRVAVKVNGVYSLYGTACDVRFEYQQSKVQTSQCGATISNVGTSVWANQVVGATAYKFEIADSNNNITYLENATRAFTFSQFAYLNNTTYNVPRLCVRAGFLALNSIRRTEVQI
jgi:hypothetical protein